jgi:hypothetical protein
MKQVQRLGEDNCNNGLDAIWSVKLFQHFFVHFWFPPKCQLLVSIQTVLYVCKLAGQSALAPMQKRFSASIQFAILPAGALAHRNDEMPPLFHSNVG